MRSGKTRMLDGKLQEATWFEHSVSFSEHTVRFWDVHEAHKADGKVKRGIAEWKLDRARNPVVDAEGALVPLTVSRAG